MTVGRAWNTRNWTHARQSCFIHNKFDARWNLTGSFQYRSRYSRNIQYIQYKTKIYIQHKTEIYIQYKLQSIIVTLVMITLTPLGQSACKFGYSEFRSKPSVPQTVSVQEQFCFDTAKEANGQLCLIIRSDGNQLFHGLAIRLSQWGRWLRILVVVNLTRHGLVAGMCRLTPIRHLLCSVVD